MGYAFHLVQAGDTPRNSKKMKDAQLGAVELIADHDGDTYRAIYTVRFAEVVYVLHAFKKKSKKGIATPKHELELIQRRLRAAEADYEENYKQERKP
jgi:phage-related protein